AVERRCELVDPLDSEPVFAQRVVLSAERFALGLVEGEPQAADASKRIACQLLHAVERPLGELHHEPGTLGAEQPPRLVVRRRRSAQREPAVPTAGAAGDLTRFMETHSHTAL